MITLGFTILHILSCMLRQTSAFAVLPATRTGPIRQNSDTNISPIVLSSSHPGLGNRDVIYPFISSVKSNVIALGVFAGLVASLVSPLPSSAADLRTMDYINRQSLVVETTFPEIRGQSFDRAEIDTKALLRVILANRKDLSNSLKRILNTADEEFRTAPWASIGRELMTIKNDVETPQIKKISAPTDWRGAIKEVAAGRISAVVDGEFVYVTVEETRGATAGDDEITIRVRGTRLGPELVVATAEPVVEVPDSEFWKFWNAPLFLPGADGVVVSKGNAILGSTAVGLVGLYVGSYQYYLSEIQAGVDLAEAKKAAAEAKKATKKEMMAKEAKEQTTKE